MRRFSPSLSTTVLVRVDVEDVSGEYFYDGPIPRLEDLRRGVIHGDRRGEYQAIVTAGLPPAVTARRPTFRREPAGGRKRPAPGALPRDGSVGFIDTVCPAKGVLAAVNRLTGSMRIVIMPRVGRGRDANACRMCWVCFVWFLRGLAGERSRDRERLPEGPRSAILPAMRFRIGLVQMRCVEDAGANLAAAERGIRQAVRCGARVIALPELFRGPYFCQKEDHDAFGQAESVPGPTSDALGRLARELEVVIVGSVFERRAAGIYHNTAVVLNADGTLVGIYRKMHIPDDPLYYEKFYFTPGDLGFRAVETRFGRVGVLVCWDQWYPEAARITALCGAAVLVYPTAIGWHPREKRRHGAAQLEAWRTIQRGHAIANGVYVAAVNRVGHEGPRRGGLDFWGSSFVCGPFGEILVEASTRRPEVLVAECDPGRIETVRRHWPFLRDRRVDAYGPILERHLDPE